MNSIGIWQLRGGKEAKKGSSHTQTNRRRKKERKKM
jgi:hypothetical protein